MEKLFQLSLKNQIAWQSLYSAALATLGLLGFAFFGVSFWVVVFALALFAIAFFWGNVGRSTESGSLFFVFSCTAVTSIVFLFTQSSFFDYWTSTQWLPFILAILFYTILFLPSFFEKENEKTRIAILRTITVLFLSASTFLFVERMVLFGYLFFFVNIFILFRGGAKHAVGGVSLRTRALAFLMALVGCEALFALRFLPFLFLVGGGVLAVFLTLVWDIAMANYEGKLTKKLVFSKAILLLVFLVFAGLFTRWTL